MKYYISRKIDATFEQAVERVKEALHNEGLEVMSEINLDKKIKDKLKVKFKNYSILGVCDASIAYRILQHEEKAGILLPCNVVIHQLHKNEIEVAVVDPTISMRAVKNLSVNDIAAELREKLERVISSLHTGVESYGLV